MLAKQFQSERIFSTLLFWQIQIMEKIQSNSKSTHSKSGVLYVDFMILCSLQMAHFSIITI